MTATLIEGRADLRSRLALAVASVMRMPVELIADETSFSSLGIDSLAAAELTAEIEDLLGVELPLTAVHEYPSIAALARFIEGDAGPSPFDRMRADSVLSPEITPHGRGRRTSDARSILLTGATGFLGAHLLRSLLDETDATVLCLVRCRGSCGMTRLHENLARYGLSDEQVAERVVAIDGDLSRPMLGLAERAFSALAQRVDAIVHGGASVDWVRGYDALRDTNVLGTREILRLACHGAPKPVHFVSSLGVCYSTLGPRAIDEGANALVHLEGLSLGYAQSKCVAESLVGEAGRRGLPVTITRPALVSGDSTSGRSNVDDLLTRFIAGCVAMGAAPDLDWRVDCLPVDQVARAITRIARAHERGTDVVHIAALRPRHWRECVLWMRLCGYELDLLPYRQWLRLLALVTPDHPLYALRSFFLQPVGGEDDLTLPELYEERRKACIRGERSRVRMSALDAQCSTIDTALLDRYFERYVAEGVVPDNPIRAATRRGSFAATPSVEALLPALTRSLAVRFGDQTLAIESVSLAPLGGDDSIVSELTSWRAGATMGLFRAEISLRSGGKARTTHVIVKAKPSDECVIEVADNVAALASPALGASYARFRDYIGFTRCHERELALYRESDPRIRRHSPVPLALSTHEEKQRWMLVLEEIPATALFHAGEADAAWSADLLSAAIDGAAEIHSVWFGRERELMSQRWLAPVRDGARLTEMAPLWRALADHAREHAGAWRSAEIVRVHEELVQRLAEWSAPLTQLPRTLIHNDFNPRNIAITRGVAPRLCAFDWELATIGLPQRDVAELLCWTLDANATPDEVAGWVERSRVQLARATGARIDSPDWELGFSAALCELLVDRLAMYAMLDRFRPQKYLSRVVRTWMTLSRYYPWQSR